MYFGFLHNFFQRFNAYFSESQEIVDRTDSQQSEFQTQLSSQTSSLRNGENFVAADDLITPDDSSDQNESSRTEENRSNYETTLCDFLLQNQQKFISRIPSITDDESQPISQSSLDFESELLAYRKSGFLEPEMMDTEFSEDINLHDSQDQSQLLSQSSELDSSSLFGNLRSPFFDFENFCEFQNSNSTTSEAMELMDLIIMLDNQNQFSQSTVSSDSQSQSTNQSEVFEVIKEPLVSSTSRRFSNLKTPKKKSKSTKLQKKKKVTVVNLYSSDDECITID